MRGVVVAPDPAAPAWSSAPVFDFPPVALGGIVEEDGDCKKSRRVLL